VEARLAELDAAVEQDMKSEHYVRARRTVEQSLSLREDTYGPASLETAPSLHHAIRVAGAQGRIADQLALRRQVLDIYELYLAPDDPRLAWAYGQLALGLYSTDRTSALDYYEREVQVREALGQNVAVAKRLRSMGKLHAELGNDREAAEHFERAADLWEMVAGRRDRNHVEDRTAQAHSLAAAGQVDDAEALLTELLEPRGAPLRTGSTRDVLKALQTIYRDAERTEDVERIERRRQDAETLRLAGLD
jgi:tetratricopeptide (TPR) repeat protein